MNIDPDQDTFLQHIRDLGFSAAEIEVSRQRDGRLFLTLAWSSAQSVARSARRAPSTSRPAICFRPWENRP